MKLSLKWKLTFKINRITRINFNEIHFFLFDYYFCGQIKVCQKIRLFLVMNCCDVSIQVLFHRKGWGANRAFERFLNFSRIFNTRVIYQRVFTTKPLKDLDGCTRNLHYVGSLICKRLGWNKRVGWNFSGNLINKQ